MLEFEGICIERGRPKKRILRSVSGTAERGEILAIMGPSGCGKSTLLNSLSGYLPTSQGRITLDGEKLTKKNRGRMSYVLQSDIFFEDLTLRETLMYTAQLRLPFSLGHRVKNEKVNKVIADVGLEHCQHTIVGGDSRKGLSGGERKRLSVACELVVDPSILLLDEPTSGLDSSSAYSLFTNLKKLAHSEGKTIVASIHQPSSQLFYSFDKLLLMAKGKVVYYGPVLSVVDHFNDIGFFCPPEDNPGDFVLNLVSDPTSRQALIGPDPEVGELADQRKSHPITLVKRLWQKFFAGKKGRQETAENENLVESGCRSKYESTLQHYEHVAQNSVSQAPTLLHTTNGHFVGTSKSPAPFRDNKRFEKESSLSSDKKEASKSWEKVSLGSDRRRLCATRSACWGWQFLVLVHRSFRLSFCRLFGLLPLIQMLGYLLTFSMIWYQTPYVESSIRDRQSLLFYFPGSWGFVAIALAAPAFPQHWLVTVRERAAHHYHFSAYFLAQVVVHYIGLIFYPSIFLAVLFPVGGLQGVGAFFATWAFFLLTSLASGTMGFFFGALFMDTGKAYVVASTIFIPMFIVGGFFLHHPSNLVAGLSMTSMLRYTYHALSVVNNGRDVKFLCNPVGTSAYAACNSSAVGLNGTASLHYITGPQVVEALGFTEPVYIHACALLCFIVLPTLLTYLAIRAAHGRQKPV